MDDEPQPAPPGAPWAAPAAAPVSPSPPTSSDAREHPAPSVSLSSGPPSPWAPGSNAAVEVPPAWLRGETAYVASPSTEPRRSRRVAAVVAAAVLVAGGIATTVVIRQQRPAAQATPEAAVLRFLGALEDQDLLGAAETLPRAERNLIVDVFADLRDAKVPDTPSDASLHKFGAYTLEIDRLVTTRYEITDTISVVELTGGTYAVSGDAGKLPFGIGAAAAADGGPTTAQRSGNLADLGPLRLATVHDGDGWHVSLLYTAAEQARTRAGLAAPDTATRIAARGAATPEDAVRQLVDAASKGQWERMIELTPPDEMAALHDYGRLLLDGAPKAPATPWFTVTRLEFESKTARNATVLRPKALAASAVLADRKASITVEPGAGNGCWHIAMAVEGEHPVDRTACAKDGFLDVGATAGRQVAMTAAEAEQLQRLSDLFGIVTVQVDGLWYVSPARTGGRLWSGAFVGLRTAFRAADSISPPRPLCPVPSPSATDDVTGSTAAPC